MPAQPSRRALLALAAVAGLAGCTGEDVAPPPLERAVDPAELAVRTAGRTATDLRGSALGGARLGSGAGRRLLLAIAADHADHLTALGLPVTTPTATTPTATGPTATTPTATAPTATAPASTAPTATVTGADSAGQAEQETRRQADAEWAAATAALGAGVTAAAGGLGLLLVRIAASRAVHADLLSASLQRAPQGVLTAPTSTPTPTPTPTAQTPTGPTTGPTTATATPPAATQQTPSPGSAFASPTEQALQRQLAGEHAAVFAFALVIARLRGADRRRAQRRWAQHRALRDRIEQRLQGAGITPVPAEAAYAVSPAPRDPEQAKRLAARVEAGLAALAADVVATAPVGTDREAAATDLVATAREVAGWTGRTDPLPGTPAAG